MDDSFFKYEAVWSKQIIDSTDFPLEFQNPNQIRLPFGSETFYGDVKLGNFILN